MSTIQNLMYSNFNEMKSEINYICHFSITNELDIDVNLYFANEGEIKDENHGIIGAGETIEKSSSIDTNWYVTNVKTGEIYQEFEILDTGMHFFVISQPRIKATNDLIEKNNEIFLKTYKKNWMSILPRRTVRGYMWNSEKKDNLQYSKSTASFWEKGMSTKIIPEKKIIRLELRTLFISPKVFEIINFLSDGEVNHLLEIVNHKREALVERFNHNDQNNMKLSIIPSQSYHIEYNESVIVENIYNRISDILKLSRMHTKNQATEPINIEIYKEYNKTEESYDFILPNKNKENMAVMRGNNRFVTFMFILKKAERGGGIYFPSSKENTNIINPFAGSAILLYNMTKDGNLDINSMYKHMLVEKGEECIAKIWVWDSSSR